MRKIWIVFLVCLCSCVLPRKISLPFYEVTHGGKFAKCSDSVYIGHNYIMYRVGKHFEGVKIKQ